MLFSLTEYTFIGKQLVVPKAVRVLIDCGSFIDSAIMEGEAFSINWYKNGRPIANGSAVNVVIAADYRTIEIIETIRSIPAQVGTEGNYSCEVCTDDKTCQDRTSVVDVCSKYHCLIL